MFDADFITRFEAKINKTDGCWEWTASCAGAGYGQMKLPKQRKQEYSHRLAYMIYKGPIAEGQFVCHTCDNTKCCNPDHLFLGTQKENLRDMASKGRSTHGVTNPMAKLTEKDVVEIFACLAAGMSQTKIAKAFGVHQSAISKINRGHRWLRVASV